MYGLFPSKRQNSSVSTYNSTTASSRIPKSGKSSTGRSMLVDDVDDINRFAKSFTKQAIRPLTNRYDGCLISC